LSLLADVDRLIFGGDDRSTNIVDTIESFMPYVERELAKGVRLNSLARHLIGLFQGLPGARAWRRYLAENAPRTGADANVIREAAMFVASHDISDSVS